MRCLSTKLHIFSRLTALLCALLLCALLVAPAVAAEAPGSGRIGALTWSVSAGALVITGQGAIPDYTEHNPAPWSAYNDEVYRLELGNGITRIGAMAFYDFVRIRTVSVPFSVKEIGAMAFAGCEAMETIVMPQVKTIESYAFSRCFALDGVVLPNTLTALDDHAFYRCVSLSYIRVPASVTTMGRTVFAYCSSLLRADIEAPITSLPEWFFYGCDRLEYVALPASVVAAGEDAFTRCDGLERVYYAGDDEGLKTLIEDISKSLPDFTAGSITKVPPADQPPVTDHTVIGDGNKAHSTETEVSTGTDLVVRVEQTITSTVKPDGSATEQEQIDTTIHATITGDEGWNTVVDVIKKEELEHSTFEKDYGDQSPVDVQITLQQNSALSGDWLSQMAGHDAVITITTPDGSRWTFDCQSLVGQEFEKSYNLSYSLLRYENPTDAHRLVVGSAPCYWLSFYNAVNFPVTVEVFLDPLAARQNATLYESVDDGLEKLQAAMIDRGGYVSFRLAVINTATRYLVAMNVSGTNSGDVIVPDSMFDNPDDLEEFLPLDERYSISEPRGFMGMTMKEFTALVLKVAGAFAAVLVVCALFFVIRGKRKAKIAAIRAKVMGTDVLEEYNNPKKAKSFRELTKRSSKDKK